MLSLQAYMHQGHHRLRRLALDPRVQGAARAGVFVAGGFCLSAASLVHSCLPLSLGLVCAGDGWSAALAAVGGAVGYWVFWGPAGYQGILWMLLGLVATLLVTDRRICRDNPVLLPAAAALIVAASGVIWQSVAQDETEVPVYLLRVALGGGSAWLLIRVLRGRNPILDWIAGSLSVLALAQLTPIPRFSLGYVVAGALGVIGPFPAAALAGLALDLARITKVPMTAVLALSCLARLLPIRPRGLYRLAPVLACVLVMSLRGSWELAPVPGLLAGSLLSGLLPRFGRVAHRRGETGAAQVRLELVAGVLAQTEQVLLEAPERRIDEDGLVTKAAELACAGCPCRKSCKDASRILQLPGLILHKPLVSSNELPIICRKSGRFLAELHRAQERLRSIRADRERQREYRWAVIQQYRFLAEYLRSLSDQLARKGEGMKAFYEPEVRIFSNRPEGENGDRCMYFSGIQCRFYVLLCDGMGTGPGAVQEAKTAGTILRRLLGAGYPAAHALRSLNSLCALRERAGAVTVDLAEIRLDSGRGTVYKWGAAPSYALSHQGAERLGAPGPPPGLSVTDCEESTYSLSLRRGELLVMTSDGISQEEALRCCREAPEAEPEVLAARLLALSALGSQDDATLITLRLRTPLGEADR